MNQYYPERAQRMNVGGRVEMNCEVTNKGTVQNCSITSEEPSGQDFGNAALKLTRFFKMRPAARDGTPVGGQHVNIPIRFVLPKD
jgi:protein TonB